MSDYLWDKQGEADPEIEQLEHLLAPLRHRPTSFMPPAPRRSRRPWVIGLTAATAVALVLVFMRPKPPEQAGLFMSVHGLGATVADRAVAGNAKLAVGAWLDTGASTVTLTVGSIGNVELAAGSRLRIVETGAQHQALELARGGLVAQITAPPRSFTVKTKHTTVADLGCAFELRVDPAGEGRLTVTQGRVALSDASGGEVTVAAGAECGISAEGPGAPFPSDVSAAFRDAMLRYPHDHSALAKVLDEARPKDRDALDRMSALLDGKERAVVEQRIVELQRENAPKPSESTTPVTPHASKIAPSHEHKHTSKAASHVTPSHVTPVTPHAPPSNKTTAPPTRDRLEHDPFRSTPAE
jgi:ferric-dicitrate binding protein FerR (iron transport regulator)